VHAPKKPKASTASDLLSAELVRYALRYPEAYVWAGTRPKVLNDIMVEDAIFMLISRSQRPFEISCRLPFSAAKALKLPGTQPASDDLPGKGWVTFSGSEPPGKRVFQAWIDESYRAQAPKKYVRRLRPTPKRTQAGRSAR
jgi:hypothetical protein